MAETAALLIALALDPDIEPQSAAPPVDPPPAARPPNAPAQSAPATGERTHDETATPPPPLDAEPAPTIGVELALLVDLGVLPGTGVGASIAVSLELEPVVLHVGAEVLMPTRSSLPGTPSATADFTGIFAFARGCARWLGDDTIRAGPCAIAELGTLTAQTQRIAQPRSDSVLWLAAGLGAMGSVELGRGVHASLSLFALIPQRRWGFWVFSEDGRKDVHRVAPVLARVMLGLGGGFE